MSSYIDHRNPPSYVQGRTPDFSVTVDWRELAERRLLWLYGPNHKTERAAMTASDLAAWNALGSGRRPAA
jgi:hypothetical protein